MNLIATLAYFIQGVSNEFEDYSLSRKRFVYGFCSPGAYVLVSFG